MWIVIQQIPKIIFKKLLNENELLKKFIFRWMFCFDGHFIFSFYGMKTIFKNSIVKFLYHKFLTISLQLKLSDIVFLFIGTKTNPVFSRIKSLFVGIF